MLSIDSILLVDLERLLRLFDDGVSASSGNSLFVLRLEINNRSRGNERTSSLVEGIKMCSAALGGES